VNNQCECMDGPNLVDPTCLFCGGTGEYVSDERLEELRVCYAELARPDRVKVSTFDKDRHHSDRQHLAIVLALQIARAEEAERVREWIGLPLTESDKS
jgi:hypothetical protein